MDWNALLRQDAAAHRVTPEQAKEWIAAYQNRAVVSTAIRSWTWPLSVYEALASTPGAAGVREYLGVKEVTRRVDGIPHAACEVCPILTAVDADGKDMWEAGVFEISHPCPPLC